MAIARTPALRTRVEALFWRGLTLLAFAAVIALIFVPPVHAATASFAGVWRVTLAHPGGELPFGLEVGRERGKPAAWLLNPPERLRAERVEIDGNQLILDFPSYGSRVVATLGPDGRLTGSASLQRRAGTDSVEAVEVQKPPVDRIAFSFPDSSGKRVSLSDARFKGKVVVVTLGGAWCPNCHDEARFIGPYAAAHKSEGLEVIGLQFEVGDDPARAFAQIDRFGARYGLRYPLLLAGQPTAESSKAALPAIGGVRVYPSTLFIGRDGRLREIHVGWAGPATGPLNAKAKRDFDATVQRLLREKV